MFSKSKKISRRKFLTRSAQAAAGIITAGTLTSSGAPKDRVRGANERINIAIIGLGGVSNDVMRDCGKIVNLKLKTICDVDENRWPEFLKRAEQTLGYTPATEYDLRRIYDDDDIDAIYTATPNHWHALATIWACQAGKRCLRRKTLLS